jgi:hypothetical protein
MANRMQASACMHKVDGSVCVRASHYLDMQDGKDMCRVSILF